jgi:hypothetical protein
MEAGNEMDGTPTTKFRIHTKYDGDHAPNLLSLEQSYESLAQSRKILNEQDNARKKLSQLQRDN